MPARASGSSGLPDHLITSGPPLLSGPPTLKLNRYSPDIHLITPCRQMAVFFVSESQERSVPQKMVWSGGAAAHQWVVHLEQSLQRELVCGSGAAACAAQTTSSASRPVQSGPSPSPASARGRAVDSGRGCPAGRAGGVKRLTASSPTSHPRHPTSRRSRASSDLIRGKAA